ncbi:WD domain-containing [Pyrenophora seminiperda CCB06]|uniref:WD domain-containing n=1 Tax=Pyrenophora seminiperda CCB06 TaxID=1302712 RepID=A0A3M7M663_9PLEO|nr:WD domain-containing [Pyrenophora seminiperda CCB06]
MEVFLQSLPVSVLRSRQSFPPRQQLHTMRIPPKFLAIAAYFTLPCILAINPRSSPPNPSEPLLWKPNGDIATAEEWASAVQKGNRLTCRLEANDEAAGRLWQDTRNPPSAHSEWADATLQNELVQWAWDRGDYDAENCDFSDDVSEDFTNKIGTTMQALGVSAKPRELNGDIECFNIQHFDDHVSDSEGSPEPGIQYYVVEGREYQCTGAHVRFGINHRGGMIIGIDFKSPRYAARLEWGHEPYEDELPRVKRVSDIMTAYWLRDNPTPRNLKYYIASNVLNKQTVLLLSKILVDRGHSLVPYWPGLTVGMWEDAGEALLGSPIGTTLAFLLAQHKAELGIKHVTDITIFRENYPPETSPAIHILFRIEDVHTLDGSIGGRAQARDTGPNSVIRIHHISGS